MTVKLIDDVLDTLLNYVASIKNVVRQLSVPLIEMI